MREVPRRILRSPGLWLVLGLLLTAYVLVSWVESAGGPEAIRARYGVLAPAITSSIQKNFLNSSFTVTVPRWLCAPFADISLEQGHRVVMGASIPIISFFKS